VNGDGKRAKGRSGNGGRETSENTLPLEGPHTIPSPLRGGRVRVGVRNRPETEDGRPAHPPLAPPLKGGEQKSFSSKEGEL